MDHHPPQPTRPALAPGTAPLALRNARLTQHPHRCTTLPRPRVSAACRASRPCGAPGRAVLRRLRHRPGQARHITAFRSQAAVAGPRVTLTQAALGRDLLPLSAVQASPVHHPPPPASVRTQASTRHSDAARPAALRRLRAAARSAPQRRFLVHNRSGHGLRAALLRRAMLRQGSAMPGFSSVQVGQRC